MQLVGHAPGSGEIYPGRHWHWATRNLRLARIDVASSGLVVILAVWVLYAGAFIYFTSTLIDGVRYFVLFDDEMILDAICGQSRAWLRPRMESAWPPIEGFTNPLWVFIMALFHLLPLPAAKMSLPIQLLGIALGLGDLLLVWRLTNALTHGAKSAALSAVALTAFYFPLNHWMLRGTEVALLAPLLTLAVLLAIRTKEGGSPRWLWFLLADRYVRALDLAAPAILLIAMVGWFDRERRRKHLIDGIGCLILFWWCSCSSLAGTTGALCRTPTTSR